MPTEEEEEEGEEDASSDARTQTDHTDAIVRKVNIWRQTENPANVCI